MPSRWSADRADCLRQPLLFRAWAWRIRPYRCSGPRPSSRRTSWRWRSRETSRDWFERFLQRRNGLGTGPLPSRVRASGLGGLERLGQSRPGLIGVWRRCQWRGRWVQSSWRTRDSKDSMRLRVLLLDHGAQTNRIDALSSTAIYAAAAFGRDQIVKLLLDRGADQSLCGENGKTATAGRFENGFTGIAELIRARGGSESCHQ